MSVLLVEEEKALNPKPHTLNPLTLYPCPFSFVEEEMYEGDQAKDIDIMLETQCPPDRACRKTPNIEASVIRIYIYIYIFFFFLGGVLIRTIV